MQLTTKQQEVFDQIKEFIESDASVFILRGYAGTGKTTMVKQVADYVAGIRDLHLMAPTGRAARVLHEKTGHEASTIHKAIYGEPDLATKETKVLADSEFKICFSIAQTSGKDVAIVDESSMLSTKKSEHELFVFGTDNLMDDLLTFIRPQFGGKVIFVGDPAQLPPVGQSCPDALNADFFREKGLKVMEAQLTEVLRQSGDSVILKNAMMIRDLLDSDKRNRLVFDEHKDDVETIKPGEFLPMCVDAIKAGDRTKSVVICFSNKTASKYNKDIRKGIYGVENAPLRSGDVLMVVQNNYALDLMNGEFAPVVAVGECIQHSAPVYVQEGGERVQKTITLTFVHVQVLNSRNEPQDCMLLLDLLENERPMITIDEHRALFINFCMRHPELRQGSEEFAQMLSNDLYYNCLKAKYGYAVTGHKCQGGEWEQVFVDYSGRTGLSDDCLRWAYTATTRAQKTLYVFNLPHITPFSKFRIDPIQQVSKINEEFRVYGDIEPSPYHKESAPACVRAKYQAVSKNMEMSGYEIVNVESKPYLETYSIKTPTGVEKFKINYKGSGLFNKAVPIAPTENSVIICMFLDSERTMPLVFDYTPSSDLHSKLFNMVCSACDGLSIDICNVVEHNNQYYVNYYFRTSDSYSYIKFYINANGFVSYAAPMSLLGSDDNELAILIEEIINHFE